jgi:hypothetical protein
LAAQVLEKLVRPERLLRGLQPLGLADARLALRAINLAYGQVVEPAFCLSAVRIIANQYSDPTIVLRYTKILVRPDGLFALRAHPFGVALRAINLAYGQVVEPAFCLSAVRIIANQYSDPTIVLRYTKILVRPDGLLAAAPLVLRFAPDRRRYAAASNLAEASQVVEPAFCLSAVRMVPISNSNQ